MKLEKYCMVNWTEIEESLSQTKIFLFLSLNNLMVKLLIFQIQIFDLT